MVKLLAIENSLTLSQCFSISNDWLGNLGSKIANPSYIALFEIARVNEPQESITPRGRPQNLPSCSTNALCALQIFATSDTVMHHWYERH